MKSVLALLYLLLCLSAKAQLILPIAKVKPLGQMIDSLSYPASPQFEENYSLKYDAESGQFALSTEKFLKGTATKTPDQYLSVFKLSDIDPTTVTINGKDGYAGLLFYTANNKAVIDNYVYVDGEIRMHLRSDRQSLGFWKAEGDKDLLRRIKIEMIRLIDLIWDGTPPQYYSDTDYDAPLILNGEEVVFSNDTTKEGDVFITADQMPLFDNAKTVNESDRKVEKYFKQRLIEDSVHDTGNVYAGFYVEKDGTISNIELLNGCGNRLDGLILKYLRFMPKWKPGYKNGKPVTVVKNVKLEN